MEGSFLALLDHIRSQARDPLWYHAFSATMDADVKLDTISALIALSEADTQAGPGGLVVLGRDLRYDRIREVANWARSRWSNPVHELMRMTSLCDKDVPQSTEP